MALNFFHVFLCVYGGVILLTVLFSLPCITRRADHLRLKIVQWHNRRHQTNQPGHYGFHQHPEYFDIELAITNPRDLQAVLPPRPVTPWPRCELDVWWQPPSDELADPRRVTRSSFAQEIAQSWAESSRRAEIRARAETIRAAMLGKKTLGESNTISYSMQLLQSNVSQQQGIDA